MQKIRSSMFIDSHCHLQFKSYDDDRDAVIARCREKGMLMNTIGTQIDTSKAAIALAENYTEIYATIGLHPIQSKKVGVTEEYTSFVARGEDFDTEKYQSLIDSSEKVIAVGETGLDAYHVPKDQSLEQVMQDQWDLFLKHHELAKKNNLPLVLHIRDAHPEMIARMKQMQFDHPAVVHCFTGNWEEAQEYLNLGCYLGFTGVITFPPKKNTPEVQERLLEVVDNIPLDRVLVETDAPFLAPQAYRGGRSEPWMTEEVITCIAKRRDMTYEDVRDITVENTKRLFINITI